MGLHIGYKYKCQQNLVSLQLIVVPGSIWNALIAMFASAEERYSRLMFRLVRLKEDSALR